MPQVSSKTYRIYLVRHGLAEERGEAYPDDTKRPLTSKGVARMRQIARGLRDLDVSVDIVLTSPLLRAQQTAELLVAGLKPAPALAVVAALSPGVLPAQVAEALTPFRKARRVALVGHAPGIGELAAWLIGARSPLPLKKGGACRIDVAGLPLTGGGGQLVWCATPRMLRELA